MAIDERYKYSEITEKIIGCAMKVHRYLGNGFPEYIYQKCLKIEFDKIGLNYLKEIEVMIFYFDEEVGKRRVDFLVENVVLVELKAIKELDERKYAQILNYLTAYKLEVGLLINFGEKSLKFKRFINSKADQ